MHGYLYSDKLIIQQHNDFTCFSHVWHGVDSSTFYSTTLLREMKCLAMSGPMYLGVAFLS